jgi:hypothetical protein
MAAPFVLVVALLSVESSYSENLERPTQGAPDTVQFWFSPEQDWRIKTFAIDHDIHTHRIGDRSSPRRFTPDDAVANTRKHYGDVLSTILVLEFPDPRDSTAVSGILAAHGLHGTLEIGNNGVAFYNPDSGHYRSQSVPE